MWSHPRGVHSAIIEQEWEKEEVTMEDFLKSAYGIFVAGCIGAAAPEIVRLYKLRSRQVATVPRTYWLFSLLFFFLGGVVAILLPATTPWGALYIGISLPTLVSSWGGKPPNIPPLPPTAGAGRRGGIGLIVLPKLSKREFLFSIWL